MNFKWDVIENSIAFIVIGGVVVLGKMVELDSSLASVAIAAIAGLAGRNQAGRGES
jgi:hypothetical protein